MLGLGLGLGIGLFVLQSSVTDQDHDHDHGLLHTSTSTSTSTVVCNRKKISYFNYSPICGKVPNASTASLWNVNMNANTNTNANIKTLPSFWTWHDLQRGVRSKPRLDDWGKLLEKVHQHLEQQKQPLESNNTKAEMPSSPPPPIQVLVLSGDSKLSKCHHASTLSSSSPSPSSSSSVPLCKSWIHLVESSINTYFGTAVVHFQLLVVNGTTCTFAKSLHEKKNLLLLPPLSLLLSGSSSSSSPNANANAKIDILIDAYASQEMALPPNNNNNNNNDQDVSRTPDFANEIRANKDAWIRSVLLLDSCCCPLNTTKSNCTNNNNNNCTTNGSNCSSSSILLLVLDDFVGQTGMLTDSIYTRVVQRLADWYEPVAHVSWGAMMRPLLYGDGTNSHRAIITSQAALEKASQRGIAQLLLWFMLDMTIDYCSSSSSSSFQSDDNSVTVNHHYHQQQQQHQLQDSSISILHEGVQDLVDKVVPPSLDLTLALQHVSSEWKAAANDQANTTNNNCCLPRNTAVHCPVKYVLPSQGHDSMTATTTTTTMNSAFSASHQQQQQQSGWISKAIELSPASPIWTTSFRLDHTTAGSGSGGDGGEVEIFLEHGSPNGESELQIQVVAVVASAKKKTQKDDDDSSMIVLLSSLLSTAHNRHVVLPHRMDLNLNLNLDLSSSSVYDGLVGKEPMDVMLTLELQSGASLSIVGLFVCN